MLQEARDLQNNAVKELIKLSEISLNREITFKAPTGSGKTFMMAKMMDEILKKQNDVIFLVSTLSKGNLAKQNYDRFCEYKQSYFKNLNPYIINSETSGEERLTIPKDYNVYVIPVNLLMKTGKIMKSAAMEEFLQYITKSFINNNRKRIFLIKDECHIETKNLNNYKMDYFDRIFNISATPDKKKNQIPDVEINEEDAINASLIKRIELKKDNYELKEAIDKLKEIKEDYINKLYVNPCLIIQISNEIKGNKEIDEIIPQLEKAGLKWVLMLGDRNDTNDVFKVKKLPKEKWRDYIKTDSSNIDVVIFKLTISEGFDIPRACMLYQVRDVKSEQLKEQVVGRVRRNPRLLDFEKLDEDAKKLAMTCYVWGDIEKNNNVKEVEIKKDLDVENEIKIKTTRLKNLKKSKSFNIKKIIDNKTSDNHIMNIFDVYRNLQNKNTDIIDMCDNYIQSYDDWFKFNQSINDIMKNYNKQICDYEKNMETTKDEKGNEIFVSLPKMSSYVYIKENRLGIRNWVWKNLDDDTDFSFDSDAERKWAEFLKELLPCSIDGYKGKETIGKSGNEMLTMNDYYWGKNFLQSSEIKYEYYLDGKHFNYPDFIMKDSFGNIHIFEVKSINSANNKNIDKNEYDRKIGELRRCYKKVSELTGNIFYLPLLDKNTWQITRFKNGEEENITDNEFKQRLINNQ